MQRAFYESRFFSARYEKKLRPNAVPSVFPWSQEKAARKKPFLRDVQNQAQSSSDTTENANNENAPVCLDIPKEGGFSMNFLVRHPNKGLVKFYTGFKNSDVLFNVLDFILPNRDRQNLKYYDSRFSDTEYVCGEDIFDSDDESSSPQLPAPERKINNKKQAHKLCVEDEFLLVLGRLRLGLFYEDLATRFDVSVNTVQRIFYTWINLMFVRLGSLKCFPHRDVILSAMKPDFRKEYPNAMLILDCTEIRVQSPSSLLRQSQTFSNYKSTNTLKGLIGVDSRGGIMFVSQLYTGSISDKNLCTRSGLFDLLSQKVQNGELHQSDPIIADRGFTIQDDLKKIGLELNIPPFLGSAHQFSDDEVVRTQTIARHRIHVERAIGKLRNFHIFDRRIPVNMFGIINQIWLVCCMLSNFQDSIA